MRYSDALMMKAEAIARGGAGTNDVTKLTALVSRSGQVGTFPTTLDGIYKERGKELWLEGWRRNDMVRFGTFLAERQLKPYVLLINMLCILYHLMRCLMQTYHKTWLLGFRKYFYVLLVIKRAIVLPSLFFLILARFIVLSNEYYINYLYLL
jgi:hypothetical protein